MTYIGVIKLEDHSLLPFGPFKSYESANNFIQKKFLEYPTGKCAYVEGLLMPILFPSRRA